MKCVDVYVTNALKLTYKHLHGLFPLDSTEKVRPMNSPPPCVTGYIIPYMQHYGPLKVQRQMVTAGWGVFSDGGGDCSLDLTIPCSLL